MPTIDREESDSTVLRKFANLSIISGIIFIFVFSIGLLGNNGTGFLQAFGTSLSLAFGAALGGGIIGFLFGIPRTLQREWNTNDQNSSSAKDQVSYRLNTNLEEISDWLTKILIGVGLIEIKTISSNIYQFSSIVGQGFDTQLGTGYVLGLLAYFFCIGFLLLFLWARLWLRLIMEKADHRLADETGTTSRNIVLSTVQDYLTPQNAGQETITKDHLSSLVSSTGRWTKSKVFEKARVARWSPETSGKAIDVFQMLIQNDNNNEFHRNYAEIAYAQMEKDNPTINDFEKAATNLKKAIEIRDRLRAAEFTEYEFMLAICEIKLEATRDAIIQTLEGVEDDQYVRERRKWAPRHLIEILAKWFDHDDQKEDETVQQLRKVILGDHN